MEDKIRKCIRDIEEEYGVHAISCRSFGSHMMNLDSPDSDYDAFLIFAQDASDYATIGNYRDTISYSEDEIDFQCWNVKKFGELLNDSNPTAMEFLNSDTIYYEFGEFTGMLDCLREDANENFVPIALYYHYRSMAESNYMKYLKPCIYHKDGTRYPILQKDDTHLYTVDSSGDDDISGDRMTIDIRGDFHKGSLKQKVKRNLYVVRAILYAKHIRETHKMPRMNFPAFVETMEPGDLDMSLSEIRRLKRFISMKRSGKGKRDSGNPFGDFIEAELERELEHEKHSMGNMDTEMINDFIARSIVR